MQPNTIYGVCKVSGELLSNYYHSRFGVDTRSVRFPGIISNVTLPGGGTTDYAVEIYYEAVRTGRFTCPISHDVYMDMMYMPDALRAAVELIGGRPVATQTPQLVQYRLYELHSRDHLRGRAPSDTLVHYGL